MNSKKIVALWVVVAVAIVAAVAVGWWVTARHQPPAGAVTVEEAIGGGVKQDSSAMGSSASVTDEDRIVALAEALGIPVESVPRGVLSTRVRDSQSRTLMNQILVKAIGEGTLSNAQAQSVMVAFEAGLVSPAVDTIVAESAPAE